MKINSEKLYEFINNLGTSEKVKFKVYFDDIFTGTEVFWDGDNFIWESGTFSSGMFFNPLYTFEIIEEKPKKIAEIERLANCKGDTVIGANMWTFYYKLNELTKAINYLLEKSDKDEC